MTEHALNRGRRQGTRAAKAARDAAFAGILPGYDALPVSGNLLTPQPRGRAGHGREAVKTATP
jgi:hypothetical protein